MCGITGVVDFEGQAAARHIGVMTDTVRHRGPDDEGFACFQAQTGEIKRARGEDSTEDFADLPLIAELADYPCDIALAHRRLAIIDLSAAGHCPMPNADGDLWLTFNGEIYNYLELRAELTKLGHHFSSESDTEVLLAAYQQWGVDCLERFNGMFAFAIWDMRQKRLFCARDRFGIKPFHYYHRDGYFAFASEIKSLVANPNLPKRARPQAIYDYLVNGAIVNKRETFFEDIQQLPGGHALTLDAEHGLKSWQYYDLSYSTDYDSLNYDEKVAQFRELLTDAVRLRLQADVPVGSSLSGGLDSSSVVTLANQILQQEQGVQGDAIAEQQRVFCAVYAGETFDEKPHMQRMIDHTGAAAQFTHPNSEKLWASLEKMVWHQDEPFNSTAIFAQYCVMNLVRQNNVTVLLDGQGGDETLGGYHFYYGYLLAHALRAGKVGRFIKEVRGARDVANVSWANLIALTGYNFAPESLRKLGWRLGAGKLLSHKPIAGNLVNSDFQNRYQTAATIKHNAYPTLTQKLYDDVFNTNLPTLLRYEDRNSMAFHIEARVPFLDHRLVEFAFSLGADAHIRDGWNKAILRDAMQNDLPPQISRRRDKEGYTTPHARWLRELTPQINACSARMCILKPIYRVMLWHNCGLPRRGILQGCGD